MRKLENYTPTRFMAADSTYSKQMADYAVNFIECLCHTKSTWAGKPFELIDWQEQIIRDIFGTLKPNGYRQFNTAYVEIPKKMGKSELAAAVALLLTCGDGEERAEVYGCAADRQQATIVFDVAADMVRMCPALNRRVKILASQKRIVYQPTNSFYQVLSAEAYSKHGFNIHGVVFDELHTQPNRKLFDVMTKGSGDARTQPLYFLITTAGTDTNSICYETHQKAKDILEGRKIDPTFYPVIYGADETDDWTDPEVWKKANPSLGITVGIDKVEAACESAKQNPGEENSFRQLRLNQWVKQAVRWMPMEKWDACSFKVDEEALEDRVCYGGLDLSSTTDITAFVLVFPPLDEDDKFCILPYFWIPEDTLELRVRRDHVPYDVWERQGFLETTEGNVVHYGYIEKFIERLGERFNIREIAFDRWGAVQMVQNLEGMGFTVVPFGQGFKDMSPPTKELMKLTLEQKLAHGGHPVLRWMMDNIYIRIGIFTGNWSQAWTGVKEIFSSIWNGISSFFTNILNVIKGVADVVLGWFGTSWNEVWTNIKTFFEGIWNGIVSFFTGIWETIKNIVQTGIMLIGSILEATVDIITLPFRFIWENCKEIIIAVWDAIKSKVTTVINAVASVISTVMNAIKTVFTTVWNAIKTVVTTVVNAIKSVVTTVFNAIKSTATTVWTAVKTAVTTPVNAIKSTVTSVFNSVKSTVTSIFNGIKSTATSVWNGIKSAITTPIEAAKNKVKGVVDAIKGFFSGMKISLPHIKLPHFRVSGKLSIAPPSVPHLSIDWYKEGGIMTSPTIFGMNGSSLMAGGEAGAEAILPLAGFYKQLEAMISSHLNTSAMEKYLAVIADNSSKGIYLEDGTLVGHLLPAIDGELGKAQKLQRRLSL